MANRSKTVQNLTDDELTELLDKGDALPLAEDARYTPEEVDFLFLYLHALLGTRRAERASKVFDALKPAIDAQVADPAQREVGLQNLMEWALEAIQMIPETRNTFVCMPIYQELFDAYADTQGRDQVRLLRAHIQLVRHVDFWIKKGGQVGELSEAEQEVISQTTDGLEERVAEMLDLAKANSWDLERYQLHRAMARFHLGRNQPNEAIAHFKEAALLAPLLPGALPTDQGEAYLEIGGLFFQFKKFPTAKRYFQMAWEQFEALGEDYFPYSMKAEAWMEDCDRHTS